MINIVEYAEKVLKINLSYFQKDALSLLERDPEGLLYVMKPYTQDMKMVLSIYDKWKEYNNNVAC